MIAANMDPSAAAELIWPGRPARVTPLSGGITNHNFRVDVDGRSVTVEMADGTKERIPTRTTLWAAGILASSFVGAVAKATGAATDRNGRILVEPDLSLPGHPEIFAVGDAAVHRRGPSFPLDLRADAAQQRRHPVDSFRDRLQPRPDQPIDCKSRFGDRRR